MGINGVGSKWWYRLTKVIFFFVLSAIFLIGTFLNWTENQPRTYTRVDSSRSYVQCNKDKEEGLVYFLDRNSLYVDYGTSNELSDYSKTRAKELCSQLSTEQELLVSREETRLIESGIWNGSERDALIKQYKSKLVGDDGYSVSISKEEITEGGYPAMTVVEILLIVGLLLGGYIAASTFKYVVFGESYKNPLKFLRK